MSKCNLEAVKKAIETVGGAKQLASAIGVSYKSVLDWNTGRTGIALGNALKIEKATDGQVKAEDILPDYPWDELR